MGWGKSLAPNLQVHELPIDGREWQNEDAVPVIAQAIDAAIAGTGRET